MATSGEQLGGSSEALRRPGETLFAWSVFPLAFFGSLALTIALIDAGTADSQAALAGLALGYGVVVLGERLYPYVKGWNRSHDDLGTDAAWLGSTVATGALVGPVGTALGAGLGSLLSARLGSPLWPSDWPLAAQLALALVVVEFFQYRMHRLQHEKDWLWRFHASHQSAPRLYWMNAARFHFVDIGLVNLLAVMPLVALGAGEPVFALWLVASSVHGICQHANMQIRCGPLNWIFSMAELHRWHHSPIPAEANHNYGGNLIFWDIVFGTRWLPRDREPPVATGIGALPNFPRDYLGLMAAPFRWGHITREAGGEPAPRT